MSFQSVDYLRHILTEAEYLLGEAQALTQEEFAGDDTLRRAFVRSFE